MSCSEFAKINVQPNSVCTYLEGKWKRVRIKQSTFYPKYNFPHRHVYALQLSRISFSFLELFLPLSLVAFILTGRYSFKSWGKPAVHGWTTFSDTAPSSPATALRQMLCLALSFQQSMKPIVGLNDSSPRHPLSNPAFASRRGPVIGMFLLLACVNHSRGEQHRGLATWKIEDAFDPG